MVEIDELSNTTQRNNKTYRRQKHEEKEIETVNEICI